MPQLDPTWYASQLFWLFVSFFTLLFVMANFIAPKIADILARRQNKIDEYIDKAAETKRRAEESLAKYNEALSNATREANASLERIKRELEAEIVSKQDELAKRLRKKVSDGEAKINHSKGEALEKVRDISEELAGEIIKKIGISGVANENIREAVRQSAKN